MREQLQLWMRRIPSGQMRYYDGLHYNMSLHHVVQYCIRNPQEVGDVDLEVVETRETSTQPAESDLYNPPSPSQAPSMRRNMPASEAPMSGPMIGTSA